MPHSRLHIKPNIHDQSGFTLIELIMATAITAIIVAGATVFTMNSSRSSSMQSLRTEIKTDSEEFLKIVRVSWNARTQNSEALKTQSNGPCVSNCPKLTLTVAHGSAGTIETKTFTSSCAAPGSINALSQFNALNFSTALPNGCMACPAGQMPIVTVAGTTTSRFPHNGGGSSNAFRINGILGFNACFSLSPGNPLVVSITSLYLAPNQTVGLASRQRTAVLPYNNFANVKINAN